MYLITHQHYRIITDSEMQILQILAKEKDILEEETEVNCITTNAVLVDDNMKKISDINSQLEMINTTIKEYRVNSKYLAGLYEIAGFYYYFYCLTSVHIVSV